MLRIKIATPERLILDRVVGSVTIPTEMGEVTILPNHIPLVANIAPGEIKFKHNGEEDFFAVSGGFLEVSAIGGTAFGGKQTTEVRVLADAAEFGHEIDVNRAEEAKQSAMKLMAEAKNDEQKYSEAASGLERQLSRLRVAHKHRTKTHKNLESGTLPE